MCDLCERSRRARREEWNSVFFTPTLVVSDCKFFSWTNWLIFPSLTPVIKSYFHTGLMWTFMALSPPMLWKISSGLLADDGLFNKLNILFGYQYLPTRSRNEEMKRHTYYNKTIEASVCHLEVDDFYKLLASPMRKFNKGHSCISMNTY